MKDTLIEFETARLAKEKGFKNKSNYYNGAGELIIPNHNHSNNMMQRFRFEAPTQSLLQKWLRKKYDIYVEVALDYGYYNDADVKETYGIHGFVFEIVNKGKEKTEDSQLYKTYEEALEKGLMEALKIIDIQTNNN